MKKKAKMLNHSKKAGTNLNERSPFPNKKGDLMSPENCGKCVNVFFNSSIYTPLAEYLE